MFSQNQWKDVAPQMGSEHCAVSFLSDKTAQTEECVFLVIFDVDKCSEAELKGILSTLYVGC